MITAFLTTWIIWSLLLVMYYLLFARQTFFQWNRIYLIGSLMFGLILPWIQLPDFARQVTTNFGANLQTGLHQAQVQMETIIVTAQSSSSTNWWHMLTWVLLAGMLIRFIRFAFGLAQIALMTANGDIEKNNTYWLVKTRKPHLPFSFMNVVYWGQHAGISDIDQEIILKHEQAHLRQGHSWDILAIEILLIPFWWFIPLYIYKKEIRQVHEFIADADTLRNISSNEYKNILLKYIMPGAKPSISHAFTNFQLKKRLIMMTRPPSPSTKRLMYLAVLPIVILCMSFKPDISQLAYIAPINIEQSGDPIDEATIRTALSYVMEKLTKNPDDSNAHGALRKQMYTLQSKYPNQKSELLNISQKLLKECESSVYLAIVDDQILVKQSSTNAEVFDEVDVAPHFPGCEDMSGKEKKDCQQMNMVKAIYTSVKYPDEARKNGQEGMVLARFIVNKNGDVESPEIIRSVPGGCDAEVIRVVSDLKFVPGVKDGENVNVVFTLPVKFKLEGPSKGEKKQ